MRSFQKIALGSGIFFVLVVGIGLLLPRYFTLERQILISASQKKVFDTLLDLEEFQKWSPWNEYNPNSKIIFGDIKKGLNASFEWKGDKSGSGKMKLIQVKPMQEITCLVEFEDGGKALATWSIENQTTQTQLTWKFDMDNSYDIFSRYFSFFFLEKMLAKDYEKGLANFKSYLESNK